MKRIQLNIDLPDQVEPAEHEQMPYPKRDLETDIYDAINEALRTLQLEFDLTVEEFDWAYGCEPTHVDPT